ncbi:hypothetical protein [Poseidonibacter sp.]|uniref:hypothetical protein n=1 Tax=Poseidonibacter sp. TaxID=2321188 RepID=UPI003C71F032
MNELKTIKLLLTEDPEYKRLGEDSIIITATSKLVDEITRIREYDKLLEFLDKNKCFFIMENNELEYEIFLEIDYKKSFYNYWNTLLKTDIESTDTIEEYLSKLGFIKNDWGFLTAVINGVTYTLMHDPINGYALQCNSIQKRVFTDRTIPLGRKPTLEKLKEYLY